MLDDYKGTAVRDSKEIFDLQTSFIENGYAIVDLELSSDFCQEIINDMNRINGSINKKLNPDIYHYNEFPRLIEAWRQSPSIRQLALNQTIYNLLKKLYKSNPIPFSTINFTKGTEQPMHSDYFHFGSMPELMLAGVWVALEDVNPKSGPLSIAARSHKSPVMLPEDLGEIALPKSMADLKRIYSTYESYVEAYIAENNLSIETPVLRRGQAIIWAANLFHGAGTIENKKLTRYSQVTHYHFESCEFFYNPGFSTRRRYVKRDLAESRISQEEI
ncbi:MAG: phytanoyl-CoA dioxygenase family protein [Paracoccaceae bacterium]